LDFVIIFGVEVQAVSLPSAFDLVDDVMGHFW